MYPNILALQAGIHRVPNRQKKTAQAGQVRIIAGRWRGRRLAFPNAEGLRPSGDRVRETLFNWLQGDLPRARCLDLFAGSGALGFEAASRQAARVVMIEQNPEACRALLRNKAALSTTAIEIIQTDALSWLKANHGQYRPFDIVFLDPPFASNLLGDALHTLIDGNWLAPHALVYTEYAAHRLASDLPTENWYLHRQRIYGAVEVRLYRRR